MTSPLKLIATSKETRARNKAIFQEYTEIASIRHHPALAAAPHPTTLRMTNQYLKCPLAREGWKKSDMRAAVAQLAACLDIDWPEWAFTRTNVLGLILSNLFLDFVPWLERLPIHSKSKSNLIGVCFEKQLFAAAHERHFTKHWEHRGRVRPDWFQLNYSEDKARMDVGHPMVKMGTNRMMISWRAYQEAALQNVSWFSHIVPEDSYVYV
ncbi:hypothetical protein FRC08_017337 [Ceratobasidium sp. 394]|nr:hypothetical protein FRC08_017337 [Ceratobasidium sp. 394]